MGKIKQGILGGFSGKVAGVIGSSWKGIAVMKAMPLSVANPQTAAQVAQRSLFSNCSKFAVLILAEIIKPLWDRFAIKMSGYNEFIKTNIDLFAAQYASPAASLIIGKGKMASTPITTIGQNMASNFLEVNWVNDAGSGYKLATDIVYAVGVNQDEEVVGMSDGTVTRVDELINIPMGDDRTIGDVLHAYLCFKRADGTIVSDTSYKLGAVVA